MKAQFVYESSDFERGKGPEMGIMHKDISGYSDSELKEYLIEVLPILFPEGYDNLLSPPEENWGYLTKSATEIISKFIRSRKILMNDSPYEVVSDYIKNKI